MRCDPVATAIDDQEQDRRAGRHYQCFTTFNAHGVRLNTIAPMMHTEVAERYMARLPPEIRKSSEARLADAIPMGGRLGDPMKDLAPLLVFLAGAGSSYITGQVFAVDGGMTMLGA